VAHLRPFLNGTILFSSISPDYERLLKEELFGCFKYIKIPLEALERMPVRDRNIISLNTMKQQMLKDKNMKTLGTEVQQELKQLMHLQILTNKILKMQQVDNGNFKKSSLFFIKKMKILVFISN